MTNLDRVIQTIRDEGRGLSTSEYISFLWDLIAELQLRVEAAEEQHADEEQIFWEEQRGCDEDNQ